MNSLPLALTVSTLKDWLVSPPMKKSSPLLQPTVSETFRTDPELACSVTRVVPPAPVSDSSHPDPRPDHDREVGGSVEFIGIRFGEVGLVDYAQRQAIVEDHIAGSDGKEELQSIDILGSPDDPAGDQGDGYGVVDQKLTARCQKQIDIAVGQLPVERIEGLGEVGVVRPVVARVMGALLNWSWNSLMVVRFSGKDAVEVKVPT